MNQLDDNNARVRRTAHLSTGKIETEHDSHTDSESLYGFGERINPRRSFVFVSRVLGRHVPVSPQLARQAFTALADHLPDTLDGPVLITSMAETAVGLGAGVHDAYLQRTHRHDVLNFSSTRTARPQAIFGRFSEDHSHASGHTLYVPACEHDQTLLLTSRTLVMVDDETSSGNTFRSLGASLHAAGLDHFERVITLTLTDWSAERITVSSSASTSGELEAERHSLVSGSYHWTAKPDAPTMTLPDPDVPSSLACMPVHRKGDARIGNSQRTRITVPDALLERLKPCVSDPRPVLILGTGEHVWEPFLIAEALEQQGFNVRFSSTTRSPILIGHEIASAYRFKDHEQLGIRNYLYNVKPVDYSHIVIGIDTHVDNIDMSLIKALKAHLLFDHEFIDHQTLTRDAAAIEPATLKTRDD